MISLQNAKANFLNYVKKLFVPEKPIVFSKENVILWLKKVAICTFSIFLLGVSTGFCVKAGFGTNSIATFFNGFSRFTGMNIGVATNMINTILMVAAFLVNKKYINIGTIIYATVMGTFINCGIGIYNFLGIPGTIPCRIIMAIVGCLLFFLALGMFVAIGVGVNPWVAFSLIFADKFKKPFGRMKMAIDVTALAAGYLLGGPVNFVTAITAFTCGPIVQRVSALFKKIFSKVLKTELS